MPQRNCEFRRSLEESLELAEQALRSPDCDLPAKTQEAWLKLCSSKALFDATHDQNVYFSAMDERYFCRLVLRTEQIWRLLAARESGRAAPWLALVFLFTGSERSTVTSQAS